MIVRVNDVHFHVEETTIQAPGSRRPLVLLHGFTGTAAGWRPFVSALNPPRHTIAMDLLGHGRSAAPTAADRYKMDRCIDDLLHVLDRLNIEQFDLIGYSMGGRVALHVTHAVPERVGALVLESTTPGLADPAERRKRRIQDEALAADLARDGLPAFIKRWEALPLFTSQRNLPPSVQETQRQERLNHTACGLAGSLRGMGTGAMEPLWDKLPRLTMPTLIVTGRLDTKFCAIGEQMASQLLAGEWVCIDGAGHNVHLERPEAFQTVVQSFLQRAARAA